MCLSIYLSIYLSISLCHSPALFFFISFIILIYKIARRYAYESQAKVEVRVARIFNTFGPRMHPNDGRVVSNFIIQVLW